MPVAKKHFMKVIPKHHQQWGNSKMPPITFKDLARDLRVAIQPDGNVRLPIADEIQPGKYRQQVKSRNEEAKRIGRTSE